MTAHANLLTARVKARNAASGSTLTLPAHDLRVFLDGLGRLGYDVDALLATAGLQPADLENPDARIPYGAVLTQAQQEPLHAKSRARTRQGHAARDLAPDRLHRRDGGHRGSRNAATRAVHADHRRAFFDRHPRRYRADPG